MTILALVAALSAVPGVAAAGPQPPECPLLSQPTGVDHPLPGTALVARDPYSGLFSRTGTFRFSVRGPRAALDGVARVMWALDGVTRRVDDRGPSFEWIGSSSSGMPAGDHNVTVTVVPTSGPPVSVEFGLTATDCRYVDFQAFPPRRPGRGTTELLWDSAWESDDGVSLSDVAARAERNIVSALPAGLRGRAVGTLTVERPGLASRELRLRLRVPRRGSVLVRFDALRVTLHPGAKEFLTVTGLPARTQSVRLVLRGAGTRLVHARDACRMALVRGVLRAGREQASEVHGGRYAC